MHYHSSEFRSPQLDCQSDSAAGTQGSASLADWPWRAVDDDHWEASVSYYRARYYDPTIGRFLREDPLRFTGGVNFYVYVKNQPIDKIDPFGLWPSLGDIWDKGKGTWDKGKKYAGQISCFATYYYCIATTFDNLDSLSQASNHMPVYGPDELANPSQNEGASHGAHQIKQCISGNENCKKPLEDCIAGVWSSGIFPH